MKKLFTTILAVIMIIAMSCFAACVREPKPELAAPSLTLTAEGVNLSLEGVEKFSYKIDAGEWQTLEGKTLALSNLDMTAGEHTFTAKGVAEGYEPINEQAITYTVKAVKLNLSVEGKVASWSAQGLKVSMKVDDGEYTETTETSYTAGKTCNVSVKAEGGFDAANSIYYVGEAVERTVEAVDPITLSVPTLSVNTDNNGLVIGTVEKATKYQVKVNDGEYADAEAYSFEETAGSYTVSVKAVGDGVHYLDSEAATFEYEVVETALTATKTAINKVEWSFVGLKMSAKLNDGEYAETAETSYTANESCVYSLKVEGGYDAENRKYYVGETEKEFGLYIAGTTDVVIENAENVEAEDLAWEIKKYDKAWVNTTATKALSDSYAENGKAMVMDCWANGNVFRYKKSYNSNVTMNAIKVALKGSGNLNVKVQIASSASSVYATYNLGILPGYWNEYVIAINDDGWKINFGGTDYKLSDVISQMDMIDIGEVLAYCDSVAFIVNGNTANGSKAKVYVDNLALANIEDVTSSVTQPIFVDCNSYIGEKSGVLVQLVKTGENTATMTAGTISQDFTLELNGAVVTLKDTTAAGAGLTLTGELTYNGAAITITAVKGQAASQYEAILKDLTLSEGRLANTVVDFEDMEEDGVYKNENWSVEYYDNGWVKGGTINSRACGSTRVVNLPTNYLAHNYIYNPAEVIGFANMFSIRIGNYYDGAIPLKIKVSITSVSGQKTYILGGAGANEFYTMPVTGKQVYIFEANLEEVVNVKSVTVTTQASKSGNYYVYIDDVTVKYDPSFTAHACGHACETCGNCTDTTCGAHLVCVNKCYGHSVPTEGEKLHLDFEDGNGGSYNSTSKGWNIGDMNSRSLDGSKIVNMGAPKVDNLANARNYTYTPNVVLDYANKFSVKISNYRNDITKDVYLKIFVTDVSGNRHYIRGSESEFETIPNTDSHMYNIDYKFDEPIRIKSITFVVTATGGSNPFFYIDDLIVAYDEDFVPHNSASCADSACMYYDCKYKKN